MNKEHILAEIKRTAALNGGVALGTERFFQETGIKVSDWMGKIWARWGDAVKEAGLSPNTLQGKFEDELILNKYALFVRELKKLPTNSELMINAKTDDSFPNARVFERYGGKRELVKKLIEYCDLNKEFADVIEIAKPYLSEDNKRVEGNTSDASEVESNGYVYMLKAGKFYKVGRSNSFVRRSKELKIQLPEEAERVHVITTDDPIGIELYWHRRFEAKRKNGEWFELNAQDVKAFKRRKFM